MRERTMKGAWLAASALCTALLLACAGENAVQTFHAQTRQSEAARPQERGALAGCVIALDAGHGGYDGGVVGRVSGTPEKGLNLDVARRLAAILEAQGAQIVMTRTDDYALCDEHPPIRKKLQDMQRRAAIIEQSGAQMVLSIHMNEYAGRSQSGPQVFYREGCPAGRLLAGAIQEAMNETLAPKKEAFRARRRLLYPDAGQAERAGGMRVFIQRRRGGTSADGGLPPAGRAGDCAGHMGMGESAGGKARGAPSGGARRRGGSGDVNVKRLVNLQGEMYSSIDETAAFFDEIWLDSLWMA